MDIKKPNFGQQVSSLARSDDRPANLGAQVSSAARTDKQLSAPELRTAQNQAIIDASLQASISSGNKPMELLYRTAIDTLNGLLETDLGASALQTAYTSDLDVSPEATAGRILVQSTAFFDSYRLQHPDLDDADARLNFTDLIRGGIETGFADARKILDGLGVLQGDIASAIDATHALVMDGLEAFLNQAPAADPQTTDSPAPATQT
jgi:hypothetical protein